MDVIINASVDGHTLQQFADLIRSRQKYLGETTEKSVSACAIDVLRSIRATTTQANPGRTKVVLDRMNDLRLSFYTKAGKRIPCLRNGQSRYRPSKGTSVVYMGTLDAKIAKVFKYTYTPLNKRAKPKTYLIVSPSKADASRYAKGIVTRRANRYKGLARRAIGQLMFKACTLNPSDAVSSLVNSKADQNTAVTRNVRNMENEKVYELTMYDELDYALAALKHGAADVELSMQKASNKIVGLINHKCKDLLGFEKLDTPFPDVKKQ